VDRTAHDVHEQHRDALDAARDPGSPSLTRRAALQAGLAGGIALFLAACGPGPALTPPRSAPAPTPTGTLPPPTGPASAPPSPSATPGVTPSPALDLRRRIAGLLVIGFRGESLADAPWVRDALAAGLGGVILFDRDQLTGGSRNVASPAQVARLTRELRAAAGNRTIVIAVDQEGGRVTRLGPAHGFPAVASEATIGAGTTAAARTWAAGIAATLAAAGIDLNLAPVVDLDVNPTSPAIGALGRSFSADPDVVVRMATIEVEAHRSAGIRTTLKHFPGIGSSTGNTDVAFVDVTKTWRPIELEPFRRLIAAGTADLVMVGHVLNGQLDPDLPGSMSPAVVTGPLRGELGWDGVVVTDDLQATAIVDTFGRDEAALTALEAGNDLLLIANQQVYEPDVVERTIDAVATAIDRGGLTESRIDTSLARIGRLYGGTR
jgi:beta-N-acetylhexosaminidase